MNKYNTNLASEFFVLSALFRKSFDAHLTLGNKKSVDIVVVLDAGETRTIDVKANAGKNDWLLGSGAFKSAPNHFLVLMSYEGNFNDLAQNPRCWIVPSETIQSRMKASKNGSVNFLSRVEVLRDWKDFEDDWEHLRQ